MRFVLSIAQLVFTKILKDQRIWNQKSCFTYITIAIKKDVVNLDAVKREGVEFRYDDKGNIHLFIGALLDSGADLSYAHSSLLDLFEPTHLPPDLNKTHVGVTGQETGNFERVGFPIVDRFGNLHLSVFRITNNDMGVEPKTPIPYIQEACSQLGIKQETRHNFNFLKKQCKIRMLLGLNNTFTFPKQIDPREFHGTYPVASPNLKIFRTNLNDKLMVVGSIGLNMDLFTETEPILMVPKKKAFPSASSAPPVEDESKVPNIKKKI